MITDHRTKAFAERLADVVSEALGCPVDLWWREDLTNSPYSVVSRFALTDRSTPNHRSLIVKQYQPPYGEPDGPLSRLFDEYAALKFIEDTCEANGIGPRPVTLDPEQCLLVQEDLSPVFPAFK